MKRTLVCSASVAAMVWGVAAQAQTPVPQPSTTQGGTAQASEGQIGDIVVTAQRQAEPLQQVPIAVSAFTATALRQQQINTTSDLQLTLPNVTFTKTNFTSSSSFNIRGIGDLCVGVSCDAATGITVNEVAVLGLPIFQSEYQDLERVEVLRGPQGTLFGRNATAGVVNFVTAKPDLTGLHGNGEIEYGNFNSLRAKGMLNVPLTETLGVRASGYYLRRDGFTVNDFTGHRIDGRDQFDIRGSIRWQPTADTTFDLLYEHFEERDNRSRLQKQLCHRDPTGVLGCLPDRLAFETLNGNASLAGILTSREFFALAAPGLVPFALGSVYGTDTYAGVTNPEDFRRVRIDYEPRFYTRSDLFVGRIEHDFGPASLTINGAYANQNTGSSTDYNLAIENSYATNPGLNLLNLVGQAPGSPFAPVRAALIPNGPGTLCQSIAPDTSGRGVYGGNRVCAPTSLDTDFSNASGPQWNVEGHVTTKFDGMFNFLVGGTYLKAITRDNSYYVDAFGLDYASGLLGAGASNGAAYLATPFYRNQSQYFRLSSYGIFGEAYAKFSDRVKLTLGARYNDDSKYYIARTTLASFPAPFGLADAYSSPGIATFDADPSLPGNQPFQVSTAHFGRLTGRAVLDFQITPRNLLYASYSRGYKSGGINPPLSPVFAVPATFAPEAVNAFEIGSKNTLLGGTLRLNVTGFYYQYKQLQLSRIVARTSVNDNVDADIYGAEAEAVIKPSRSLLANLTFSYLRTKVTSNTLLPNPQDPSGGRADAVIIKDLTNASNCALASNSGNAAQSNAVVGATNALLGLRPPGAIPGTGTTGAFGVCGALQAAAAGNIAAFNPALAAPVAALGGLTPQQFINFSATGNPGTVAAVTLYGSGVPVNIRGNQLPQSPQYKFSAGVQYTAEFDNGMRLVPRVDLAFTGNYFGSIFNRPVNKIDSYTVVNAQIQLNGRDDRFFVRAFVQNAFNNNAVTGLYVTDASSGLFTNAFTLEPRRYGVSAGFAF